MITFEKSIGAVVFRRENNQVKFLLLNHGDDYWNFPKGHGEARESDEETLRREIAEETGLTSLQIMLAFEHRTFYFYRATGKEKEKRLAAGKKLNIFKTAVFYLAEAPRGEVKISDEHINFAWLTFPEALEKLTYKNSQKILCQAQAELEKHFAKKESLG